MNNNKVKLAAEIEAPAVNQEILGSGNIATEETQDPQMPYSTAYDGIDPVYSNNGMLGTADKVKIIAPKLAKGQLTAGNERDQTFSFTLTGAMPEVSVYVAAKDAKSSGPTLTQGLITYVSLKNFPLTVSARNNKMKKAEV